MKNQTLYLITLLLLFGLSFTTKAQDGWNLPDDAEEKKAPFEFTAESETQGKTHYMQNCRSCHGVPGQDNSIDLQPPPGDPATEKIQNNSDGVIYYKIKNGKDAMPSFANVLSPTEIWNVVAYLRTFNDDYVQEVAEKIAEKAFESESAAISLMLKNDTIVQAVVKALEESSESPLSNAAVELFAKRYFGNLPVGNPKTTNEQGIAEFEVPENLPGDSTGDIRFIARLQDQETYGEVEADTTLSAGVSTIKPPLDEKRALWNDVTKTPYWLLFSYALAVLTIWGFIFYVIYQLYLIRKLGNQPNE